MNSSYSNNVIKSDCVTIKGKVSLSYFSDKEEDLSVDEIEEVDNFEERKLELLKLEEEINQKLVDAQVKYDEILNWILKFKR